MKKQLIVDNITIAYNDEDIIKNCSFSLSQGKILSLLGSSGCGKSTLLKGIAGLLPIRRGNIILGDNIISSKEYHNSYDNRKVGMIFQDYALFPHLTVYENIAFGLYKLTKNEQKIICKKGLDIVKLSEFSKRYPHELSGGQQQRVAIARTLVCKPELILFDEPFSNLDTAVRKSLMLDIKDLLKSQNITAIFVTHDKNEAFAMADNIAIMQNGIIAQLDKPEKLYDYPINKDITDLLGNSTLVKAIKEDNHWQTEIGTIKEEKINKVIFWQKNINNADIYLRPHQISLSKSKKGNARIISKSFRGDLIFYKIEKNNYIFNVVTQLRFNKNDYVYISINLS